MTKPIYGYPPTEKDGHFYPEFSSAHDLNGASNIMIADSPPAQLSGVFQANGGHSYAWNQSLINAGQFALAPGPDGSGGNGLQPQTPWGQDGCTNPTMMDGTVSMASPMVQYVPMESMPGDSCYGPLQWPISPMEQIPPSPCQSSQHTPSPSRGTGPYFSRNNSYPFLPISRADAQFEPLASYGPSQGGDPMSKAKATGQKLASKDRAPSSARQKLRSRRNTGSDSTTHYNEGSLVSPAVTPPTKNSIIVIPDSPASESDRRGANRQVASSDKTNASSVPQPSAKQERQQQQASGQDKNQSRGQTRKQTRPPPTPPMKQARNRAAATKCRAKTKLAVADLAATEKAMREQHEQLSMTARNLRDEVLRLKNELLTHGKCNDTLIQQYLINQARMVGVGNSVLHHNQQQQRGSLSGLNSLGSGSSSISNLSPSMPSPPDLIGAR
ncbi:hypothetical protein N8I77_013461 [Diaporthe amygdali]|uniref:BZIP domain-containing protein n=1 Tax=Phomopsis amygdali TaxID=1214568 RepID=A0AAD9S1F8_PHOAM|nr:hypothetical protein N8I77_013461 [Diaporthe amygdali]